ncbi:MAG TPA: hypothetical protein PK047_11325 [Saprospiraceae bacterium]|nr:hypothetical protein [Saprospiraceae bacterium]
MKIGLKKKDLNLSYKYQPTGVSTFASPTNPSTGQSLQKSFHLSHPDKIELKKFPFPSENKKYATTQTNTTNKKTVKLNRDNGLQRRKTEHQQPTAVWRNGGGRGKLNSSFSNQHLCLVDSLVLRNPPLRQAAKR